MKGTMKTLIITILTLALLAGCGGSAGPTTGAGGMSSTTTGVGGAGGSGGSGGAAPVVYEDAGEFSCSAFETSIGPLNGEVSDANGTPIRQDGAIALLRVTPPAYPWTATALTYGLAAGGFCAITDHEVIAFVGPADVAPPVHPAGAIVTLVKASDIDAQSSGAKVTTSIASPVIVHAGEVLWIGVRLRIVPSGGGKRTCVYACDEVAPPGDPASWFSAVNADAMVDLCPEDGCMLNLLGESPSPAEGAKLHNDRRRWPFVVTGHR